MIGCLRTRVRKQPIVALYFESELVLKFYNLEASPDHILNMVIDYNSFELTMSSVDPDDTLQK